MVTNTRSGSLSENRFHASSGMAGEDLGTGDQSNQFPYYPNLWVGQPLGVILREYRRSYGLDLHQISDALKIRSVYLSYIEKGEYENLPGYVYGQGFVRSYAAYLGLPVAEMLAMYKAESAKGHIETVDVTVSAALSAERKVPPFGVILGVLIGLGVLLYLLFFVYSRFADDSVDSVPLLERINTFIFGTNEVANPTPTVDSVDADLLAGAGPIIVGVDGTVSIGPAPRPNRVQPQPTASASQPILIDNTNPDGESQLPEAANQPSYFPDGKAPFPKLKPDFTRQSIQTAQVSAPRLNQNAGTSPLISNIDPNVPLISPQAVTVGLPTFGRGVGFNSNNSANDEAGVAANRPNVANSTPIIVPAPTPATTQEPVSTPEPVQPVDVPTPATGNQIVIQAVARTWVKVVTADERTIAEQILARNATFNVPDQEGLTLLTGSLDSLALTVGGRAVTTPASISQRTDTIKLDAEALLNQR